MSSDFQRISDSKLAWRRSQAQRPVEEKLAILERLRDRARTIRTATRHKQNTVADTGVENSSTLSKGG